MSSTDNQHHNEIYGFRDLQFPMHQLSSHDASVYSTTMTDRQFFNATNTLESSIVFAAKMGWVPAIAPVCQNSSCTGKDKSSYLRKKVKRKRQQTSRNFWCWHFRCCGRIRSILHNTMFSNSTYGPSIILEVLWKLSSRTPVSMIPRLIFGHTKSEYHRWIEFFRDVAG